MRVLVFALLLSGCVTQQPAFLPDGRKGFAIECSGTDLSWNDCYREAGDACKSSGYEVIAKDDEKRASIAATPFGMGGGTNSKRTLLIACKN